MARSESAGRPDHKLEMHQAAREVGLERAALPTLCTAQPQLLVTDAGRELLSRASR